MRECDDDGAHSKYGSASGSAVTETGTDSRAFKGLSRSGQLRWLEMGMRLMFRRPTIEFWRQALDPGLEWNRGWCGKNAAALQLALTRGWAQNGSALQWIAAQKMGLVAAMRCRRACVLYAQRNVI